MKFIGCRPDGVRVSSPPSRGAWIEIPPVWLAFCRATVAPLAGGVD